ncbi:MAG: hypothetical protein ABW061_05205 [Polyangiaceae bacterium]
MGTLRLVTLRCVSLAFICWGCGGSGTAKSALVTPAGGNGTGGNGTGGNGSDAGGAGGAGVKVEVLACDDVKPGSGWLEVTPPGDLGDSSLIALDPLHIGTIYVQMHKGGNGGHFPTDGLYKSPDCGATWSKVPAGRNATDEKNAAGNVVNIHTGSLVSLIIDPNEPGVMYTTSNYGPTGIYKSMNSGIDWDQIIPADLQPYLDRGGWFNSLSADPTDPKHLVAATHTGCMGNYAPNCLAETRNGGLTWRLIHAPESGNEQCGPYILNATTLIYASGQNGAWVTSNDTPENDTPTWTKISQGANGGDTGLFPYKASNGKYYLGSDYGVLEGSADFLTWTLVANSPHPVVFVVGTGENMFAASRSADFYTSKEADPNTWSKLAVPGTAPDVAGRWLAYDTKHKLLYSTIWGDGGGGPNGKLGSGGLFRLPTP